MTRRIENWKILKSLFWNSFWFREREFWEFLFFTDWKVIYDNIIKWNITCIKFWKSSVYDLRVRARRANNVFLYLSSCIEMYNYERVAIESFSWCFDNVFRPSRLNGKLKKMYHSFLINLTISRLTIVDCVTCITFFLKTIIKHDFISGQSDSLITTKRVINSSEFEKGGKKKRRRNESILYRLLFAR